MKWTDAAISDVLDGRLRLRRMHVAELGCDVAIRLLREDEIDAAKIEATRYAKKRGADLEFDPDFYEREFERQLIWRSVFDADTLESDAPEPFFPSDSDVRTADSCLVRTLSAAYLEVQERVNPSRSLTAEGVEELVDALKKEDGAGEILAKLERDTLVLFVRSLAARVRES